MLFAWDPFVTVRVEGYSQFKTSHRRTGWIGSFCKQLFYDFRHLDLPS